MEKQRALRCRGACTLVATALVAAAGLAVGDLPEAFGSDQSPGATSTAPPSRPSSSTTAAPEPTGETERSGGGDSAGKPSARAKHAVPTIAKQVGEVSAAETTFGQHADASTDRAVPYRLIGTLPGDYAERATLRYRFTDRLDADLRLAEDSVSVSVEHGSKRRTLSGAAITLRGRILTVDWKDLKKADADLVFGDKIIVEYHASIVPDTKRFGQTGAHKNKATLSYSIDAAGSELAQTKAARTATYTYRLVLAKQTAHGSTPLSGARFQLARSGHATSANESKPQTAITDQHGTATFDGLDAGTYTLTETEAPDGYQRLSEPITVEIASNVTEMDDQLELTAKASGAAKVTGTDAGSGRISLQVRNSKADETAASEPGGAFHKTGNPLIDYAWALALTAAGAIGLIRYGIVSRKRACRTDVPTDPTDHPTHRR